jgi:hypothetical protein
MTEPTQEQMDEYNDTQEARVSDVLNRAVELSEELKATVSELAEVLRSDNDERGSERRE